MTSCSSCFLVSFESIIFPFFGEEDKPNAEIALFEVCLGLGKVNKPRGAREHGRRSFSAAHLPTPGATLEL